jgi:hypothetical protein
LRAKGEWACELACSPIALFSCAAGAGFFAIWQGAAM